MFTNQNVLGFLFFTALSIGAIDIAMGQGRGSFSWFLSFPSFLIVVAFSGLTYIKSHKYY